MKRMIVASAGAVLGLLGCGDGQAGPDYQGDPLMSLKGVVTSSEAALTAEQVPALMFPAPLVELIAGGGTVHFVKGEVEGMFPSAFTLRVYDAPPAGVATMAVDGEPVLTWGSLVAVAPNFPAALTRSGSIEHIGDALKERSQICDDAGNCLSGYPADCAHDGMSMVDENTQWPCGSAYPDNLPWEIYGFSQSHQIAYFASEAPAGSVWSKLLADGASIPAGYQVIERYELEEELSPEAFMANEECMEGAIDIATAEVAARHGVAGRNEVSSMTALVPEWHAVTLREYAEAGCETGQRLIADTTSTPVKLPFTTTPTRVGF
jgi:hypothetical protein